MADKSAIEWTEATWNPIRARHRQTGKVGWFCVHLSDGCRNCYAEGFNARLGNGVPFKAQHLKDVELFLDEDMLLQPLRWKRPRQIFVGSMTDLFADFVPEEWIDRIFAVMAVAHWHTYQVLTKRPGRMRDYFAAEWEPTEFIPHRRVGRWDRVDWAIDALPIPNADRFWTKEGNLIGRPAWPRQPLRNVWLGASVENQAMADDRREAMAALAAAGWTTFVSYEPALGPVDWTGWDFIRWLIAGGESGPKARPAHPAWFRAARDFCALHGIAFFFKQWGAWRPCFGEDDPPASAVALARNGAVDAVQPFTLPKTGGDKPRWCVMARVGKAAAGRELDGVTHDAMPTPSQPQSRTAAGGR